MNMNPLFEVPIEQDLALTLPGSDVPQKNSGKKPGVVRHFFLCLKIARQRKKLLTLDDAGLNDIGISRSDALREANRRFWDIPEAIKR